MSLSSTSTIKFFTIIFFTVFGFFASLQSLQAATITSNVTTGNWGTAATWDLNRIPANNDDVVIKAGTTITGNATVNFATYGSLTVNGTLNMGAFNMTMVGDLVINSGGNLTCTGTGTKTFNNITNYGTYTNATFTGLITCKTNFDNESSFTLNAGGLTLSGVNGGTSFTNNGTFTQTTGTITISAASTSFSFTNNSTYNNTSGPITFSGGSSSFSFSNGGTFSAGSSTITFGGAGSTTSFNNTGTFTAGTGTVTFTATNTTSYIGSNDPSFYNLTINSSTLTLDAVSYISTMSVTNNLTITNGTFDGTGTLNVKNYSLANSATAIFNASTQTNISGTFAVGKATSFVPGTGNVSFTGAGAQSIGTVASINFYDLTVANTSPGVLTVAATPLVVQDNLTINSGATLAGGAETIDIGTAWINNGGTFTPNTSTVTFNTANGSEYIEASGTGVNQSFNNISLTNGTTVDASGDNGLSALTLSGNFTLTSGNFYQPPTMTVNGTTGVTLTNGTFYGEGTLNIGGTTGSWIQLPAGAYDGTNWCGCNAIVNFDGTGAQTIGNTTTTAPSESFQDLTVNKSAGTLTLNTTVTTLTINDNFTLTTGTFAYAVASGTININNNGSASSFTLTAGTMNVSGATSNLNINGPSSYTAGTFTDGGTATYTDVYGVGTCQEVMPGTYKNLTFDASSKTLAPGTITISGTFTPSSGDGYTTTGNTIVLSAAANTQAIPVFNFDGTATGTGYNNLTVSNAQSLGGSVAVGGTLTYTTIGATAGYITLGANNLVLGGATPLSPVASATHFVAQTGTGRLIRAFNSTGAQSFTYPIGLTAAAASYAPVTLSFHDITTAGDVGVKLTLGSVDPNAVAPPTPSTNWLKAYWVFDANTTGITFDYYSASVKFVAADYNTNLGAGAAGESTMGAQVWVSNLYPTAGWVSGSPVTTRTALNPTVSGISNLGDLTFSTCTALVDAGDPTNQGYCSTATSGSVTFSLTTTGTPASYQWYENGVSLGADHGIYAGAQTATLTLNFTSGANSYNGNTYYCVATAVCTGGFTSATATLNVGNDQPPTFTISVSPPENLVWDPIIAYGQGRWTDEQCYGSTYTFTCNTSAYSGTLPLSYVWLDFANFLEFTSASNQWVINTGTSTRLDGSSWAGPQWWGNGTDDILVAAQNACGINGYFADVIIMVDSARTAPTLLAKTPNTATVCQGTSASATFNAGSGGDCTDGMPYNAATNEPKLINCSDEYQYIIDGGTPVTYAPGASISTSTAQSSVVIQASRSGGTGPGVCSGTGWVTLASWTVVTGAQITPSAVSICTGGSGTTLTASGGGSYTWSPNTGLNTTSGAVVTANPGSTTTYTVTSVASGCTTTATATVTVNTTPTVSYSGLNASYCVNASAVTLSGSPAGGTFAGTGISSSTFTPSSAGVGGPYTITYTYSNGLCSNTASHSTTVNGLPNPTFTAAPSPVCLNSTGNQYSTQSGMSNYLWSINGGTITGGGGTGNSSSTVTWTSAGTESISLNYTDGNGCTPNSPTVQNVTVNSLPSPSFSTAPTPVCINSTNNVYTTQPGENNYAWSVTGGTITGGGNATSNTATVTWTSSGNESISVNYKDANTCTAALPTVQPVTVNALPVPTFTSAPTPVCLNSSGNLYATQTGESNYVWNINGGSINGGGGSNNSTATVTWTSTGNQSISVGYTDGNGCISAAPVVQGVVVNGLPSPTFTGAPSGNICASTSETYTTQAGQNNYVWVSPSEVLNTDYSIISGGTSSDNSVTLEWLTPGTKTVTVNYSNGNNCTAASPASTSVNVNARPTPGFTASPSSPQCSNTNITYTTQAAQSNYIWTVTGILNTDYTITAGGTGTSSNTVTLQWLTAGSQTVTVNYTNSNNCNGLTAATSTITVNPMPTDYNVTGGICVPADLGLSNSDMGINYYLQLNSVNVPGGMKPGTGSPLDFGYQNSPGVYSIKAINSSTGCTDTMHGIYDVAICTATWTGGTSTDWFDPTNWSPQAVPNVCGVTVIIGNSFSNYPVISGTNVIVSNVQISAGASITLDRQSLSLCGDWSGGTGSNASVIGTGEVIFSAGVAQTISGNTQFNILQVSNTSVNGVSLASNTSVSVATALWLAQGNLDVSAGSFTLLSTSSSTDTYIDDFSSGYTGKISGSIMAQRYVPVFGSNQHFISSPVNTPAFNQLTDWGPDGSYVIPSYYCDETQSAYGSPYGQVFQYNDGHMGPNQCMLGNWQVRSAGNTVNGQGYSVYLTGNKAFSLSGTVNTGNMSVSNLNNSGYPSVSTLQGHPIESGWNLVGNPYPSTIDLTVDRGINQFQDQVLVWKTSGPFAGTWQPYVIGIDPNIYIAPFQAFMVRVIVGSTGLHSYPFYQSERSRASNVNFYRTQSQNTLQLTVDFNGVQDITTVAFNPSATNSFDDQYDANKPDGAPGRPTLYTTMNDNHWYSINTLPSLTQTATVPVGLRPEANANMTITANGLETFDPTTYIYLEDKLTGAWQNLRNGAYQFTTSTTDNQDRFTLHFTPPVQILTGDASCQTAGIINLVQHGSANWNYTIADNNQVTLTTGTLNSGNPANVSVNAGIYTVTLTDNAGYTVVKTVEIGGTQPVVAAFTSQGAAQVKDNVTFSSTTVNASSYSWDFGDGASATGKDATHTYTAEGVYNVVLTVNDATGCSSSTSHSIVINSRSATGINNVSDDKSINIWSNNDRVFVDFSLQGKIDAEIELYNILGQLLSQEKFGKSTIYSKQLTNLEAAYIIVRVTNNDQVTVKKVFIGNANK